MWMTIILAIIAILTFLLQEDLAPGVIVKKAQCVAVSVVCWASFSTRDFYFSPEVGLSCHDAC